MGYSRTILSGLGFALLAVVINPGLAQSQVGSSWQVSDEAQVLKNPGSAIQESIGKGAVLYARNCAACHGEGGKGDGPSSMSLWYPPTDLTQPEIADQSDGVLFWKITVGRGPMPNWELILSEEDRWHVINYIKVLAWSHP